ncbi:MAG: GNAT family N-acetyltransferase [Proteobacteria bacterium]|nr:GNAT family N-acetyltransferase [Pseudomonadota bacterium]
MGFFDPFRRTVLPPPVPGDGVTLRFPAMEDFPAWAALREKSRAFLEPWEPLWPQDDLSAAAFRYRVRRYRELMSDDLCYPYFIFDRADALLGAATLSNVRRGVAQMATLGYWIGEPFARHGHMTRALNALVPFAFAQLGLHRVEAACLPRNAASIALLQKTGFEREGYARNYLKIAGQWEDHLLFARMQA